MRIATSTQEAMDRRRPVEVNGRTYWVSEYVGAAPRHGLYVEGNERNDNHLPQGFMVDQPSRAVTPPHFHDVNQFQVFVRGSARMGRHPANPITVHYASGHTPYGPIVAGEDGIYYLTLRCGWDSGAKYMPGSRSRLKPTRRRSRLSPHVPVSDEILLRQPEGVCLDVLMEPDADALAVWNLRLGPGLSAATPSPGDSGGQYHVVIQGSLVLPEKAMPAWSCLYLSDDEAPLTVVAGEGGLQLLVLQFPRPA